MTPTLAISDKPDAAALQKLVKALIEYNEAHGGPRNARPLVILVSDPETNEVVGGLYGATVYDQLKIEILYLPEQLRGSGLGRRLLEEAEAEAIQRGCRGVFLETFTFQSPGFYEHLGYRRYGCLEGFPPGHSLIGLRKQIVAERVRPPEH